MYETCTLTSFVATTSTFTYLSQPYAGNPNLWSVVAFQDEITRSLNLSDPTVPKTKKHILYPISYAITTSILSLQYIKCYSSYIDSYNFNYPQPLYLL